MSRLRKDNKAEAMIGQKFGRLTVHYVVGRRPYANGSHVLVAATCDCGAAWVGPAFAIRYGRSTRCAGCALERLRAFNHNSSTRLPSGKTLVELSAETGIKVNTLSKRLGRGWPESRLAEPAFTRGSSVGGDL